MVFWMKQEMLSRNLCCEIKFMKIENGKIVAATEEELIDLYLKREIDCIMDFNEYKMQMIKSGCVIICEY